VVGAGWPVPPPPQQDFADVLPGNSFFGFVETAYCRGMISGYSCGGLNEPCDNADHPYFRTGTDATRGQIAKIAYGAITSGQACIFPTPVPTHTPAPTATPGGPCALFPADNIWNRNIAALPTHTLSDQYVASIGLSTGMHPDFGSGLYQGEPIGIPFTTVTAAQPYVPVTFTAYGDQSDPGPYPVPTNAPIEGGPTSNGDRHVLVVDTGNCGLYEMGRAFPQPDGSWQADAGAVWSLPSNALRPDTWTSADAAGLPMLPGLVRYDEVAAGVIHHALRFTVNASQRAYLWPARHYASSDTSPTLPPMGLRLRLKATVDISGYPATDRVILQALKDYGMFVADNGSSWYLNGVPDERWDNDILHQLGGIVGSNFEAVDESGLMIDPNSGQSR
ncbi:MAG TPA: hypothetical protein VKY74_11025, partial [Chloroflexia bacterium]|nr:hypothetical protein [Chloroflexia bacterium]